MFDSFIPLDLAVAPNPLGRLLNLKLASVPVDAYTFFEFWMPPEDTDLISEEAMLLRSDRDRLELICGKLLWLLGGRLSTDAGMTSTGHCSDLIYDWQDCLQKLGPLALTYEVITVTYLPQAIYANTEGDNLPEIWIIRPPTWKVSFWQLEAVGKGYKPYLLPVHLTISYGEQTVKGTKSAKFSSSYV